MSLATIDPRTSDAAASASAGSNVASDVASSDADFPTAESFVASPLLSSQWALTPFHLTLVLLFCVLFMYHNYIPLFHSDLWGHVAYGDWILKHGRLPTEEPFVPLAAGSPVVDTAWLGQTILALAERIGGAEWLQHVFALTALATYLTLTATFYRQTQRIGVAVLSAFLVLGVGWSRHAILRPEGFGALLFALVIWTIVRADGRADRRPESFRPELVERPLGWGVWLGVPVLFALWANLHGSFIVGFALLGCYTAGRAFEVLWETGEPWRIVRDPAFLRWSGLTELAVLGTLCNPLGMDLLVQTLLFPSHPNLKDIVEWFPLEMVSLEGIPMAASWVLTVFLLRHSRARMTPGDVLLLLVFNAAVCLRVRMVAWYAPVLMLVLAPHLNDVVRRAAAWPVWNDAREASQPFFTRSWRVSLFALFFVWMAFAFSPVSRPVLGGKPRPDRHIYSHDTPLGVTAYLREHPPEGLVAAPQWWGDWLVWKGPPNVQVMLTTNSVHVVPPAVWKDYLAIAGALPGLDRRLNHYRINTIVVCKQLQKDLHRVVENMPGWEVAFQDDVGMVVVRKSAIAAPPVATAPAVEEPQTMPVESETTAAEAATE
jgi:hypothetical protein